MPWIPAALAGASLVASTFGQDKAEPSQQKTGFQALPDEVKKVFLDTYLPGVMQQFNKPYQPPATRRVDKPSSIFDSQELYDLQKYSDATGGIYNQPKPMANSQPAPAQSTPFPTSSWEDITLADKYKPGQEGEIRNITNADGKSGGNFMFIKNQWRPLSSLYKGI